MPAFLGEQGLDQMADRVHDQVHAQERRRAVLNFFCASLQNVSAFAR